MIANLRRAARKTRNRLTLLFSGYLKYCGQKVFAPHDSIIVEEIGVGGLYEPEILRIIDELLVAETWFIDVGSNIGAVSLPVLNSHPSVNVLSIECSPSTWPFLERTHAAMGNARWHLDRRAVASCAGQIDFFTSGPHSGAFDGLQDTGRGGEAWATTVTAARLDQIWADHGRPPVSVIKIDIEGGEYDAILSADEIIETHRPAIIFEWSNLNLPAYGRSPEALFDLADRFGGELFALPNLQVPTRKNLGLVMMNTYTFILIT